MTSIRPIVFAFQVALIQNRNLCSKVFNLKNQTLLYTLHGHYGPVTCVFIDRSDPSFAGSGSQDGLLCVWDLHTGNPIEFFLVSLLFIFINAFLTSLFSRWG